MIIPTGSVDPAAPVRSQDRNAAREPETKSPAPVESPEVDREAVESALEHSGRDVVFGGRSIQFNYDRESNRVIVKVVAADSDEVVREIPAKEYLRFVSKFRELLGVIFDEAV